MREWEWKNKPNTVALFIHLLIHANHKETKWQGVTIKAGQIVTGRKTLSLETGLSIQQVRNSLDHLKSTGEITVKPTNKYSVITVSEWALYQGNNKKPTNEQPSNQPTSNHQTTTSKECKELEEYKGLDFKNGNRNKKDIERQRNNDQILKDVEDGII